MLAAGRREDGRTDGMQNQKQEPHTKMWGITPPVIKYANFFPVFFRCFFCFFHFFRFLCVFFRFCFFCFFFRCFFPVFFVPVFFPLCIRFQLGNSFGHTKVERKFPLCIRFQLGSSFGNTKVERKFPLCMYSFLTRQFIWEY